MQTFICPECGHKNFFDPWLESGCCSRCGYTPPPPGTLKKDDQIRGLPISIPREAITRIYKSTKRTARDFIILVRRDGYLYTFGQDATKVIKVLGTSVQVDELFDGVSSPTARISFEDREIPMERIQAAGHRIGISQLGVLTCPRCGQQNTTKDIYFPSYTCSQCDYIPPERDQLVKAFIKKGIDAVKEGDLKEGQYALNQALHHGGTPDQQAEILFWLAESTPNLYEKQEYLKKALKLNPTRTLIARSIRDTLTQVENIIKDETEVSETSKDPPAVPDAQPVHAARHICPNCGSKMSYSPEEGLLVCLSCQHRQVPSHQQSLVEEQPFVAAMAALKGHSHPVNTRSLECLACGAVFILAPATLSQTCPYCATAYTVDGEASLALIPPTGLLPFEISQTEAGARLQTWFRSKGLSISREIGSPLGIYLPLWTFDLGGSLSWETQGLLFSQARTQSVYFDDILVPAIRKILEQLVEKRDDFDLGKTVPYSPDYLANWPAETYDVTLSDAALKARWVAIDSFRKTHRISENVQLRTSGLRIETFKLILVPMWVAHFEQGGVRRRVIINGQNGSILPREFQGS